jgi:pyrroline-5-carboxylate reductase
MAHTLLIVGGGKMGSALLGGLLTSGWVVPGQVVVAETSAARRDELAGEFPGVRVVDTPEAPDGLAGAVLAVKPDVAEGACRVLGAVGVTRVLSIVAGMPCLRLETALGGQPSVVGRIARHLSRPGVGRGGYGSRGDGGPAT